MRIRLERDALAEAVAWAARSLPSRPSLPILSGLMLETGEDGVTLSTFDNTTSAKVVVPATVTDEGKTLVSGKLLADIARSLPNHPVDLTAEVSKVELVCGSARFTLQTLPVEDYPALPDMPSSTGTVNASEFERAVSQVAVAAGRDELLPVFTGVRMEIQGETLSLLATDRYRMALKEITWAPVGTSLEAAALIPGKVLADTAKSLTGGEQVTISLAESGEGEGLVGFVGEGSTGDRQTVTRLLDGAFPKVRHLMDVAATVTVRVNREELLSAVKRVSLVAERNTPLRMLIEDGQVALEAATGDQAQASEAIAAEVGYDDAEPSISAAGFNPAYLVDALNALDAPYAHFSFTQPGKPCLIVGLASADGDPLPDYKHVIMLMRLPS